MGEPQSSQEEDIGNIPQTIAGKERIFSWSAIFGLSQTKNIRFEKIMQISKDLTGFGK